jgi:5S rRNA maturation endonuclease (ribonuclease M5)
VLEKRTDVDRHWKGNKSGGFLWFIKGKGIRATMITDLEDWIEKLRGSGKTIVVEGYKDMKALAALDIDSIPLDKQAIYKFSEAVALNTKDTVILTDLDSEGKKLYGMLKENLSMLGVRIDSTFREWLFKETELRQIEGLGTYLEKEKNGLHGPRINRNARQF